VVASVLSGNRNFEGRVHANVRANYLASPPLVVAYALLGNIREDITSAPLGMGHDGRKVYLSDVWPSNDEIATSVAANVTRAQFLDRYGVVTLGTPEWQALRVETGSETYRRGNHEIMMRGTFANIRIKNEMAPGTEGGVTKHYPSGEIMPIYDAAMRYAATATPLVVFGGKEYGMGSSRDWAAKGTMLLGIKAVIAESFERIHRSNLVGMGVLPLLFPAGVTRQTLALQGDEMIDIVGLEGLRPRMELSLRIHRGDGTVDTLEVPCRVDTLDEVNYDKHGGILHYVLRGMAKAA
jgi:aconitase A